MQTSPTIAGPHRGLLDWLAAHGVEYVVHEHPVAYTARETAEVERVDPRTFAKVVGVVGLDGRPTLLVLDATDQVDLGKAGRAMREADLRLLTEHELVELAPECEPGTIPAVGVLFDLPTIADFAVRDDDEISFNAGSHRYSVRVDRPAWERAAGVLYGDLAREADRRPAWER